jgi:hypothetical protein
LVRIRIRKSERLVTDLDPSLFGSGFQDATEVFFPTFFCLFLNLNIFFYC